jgi:F-type H+-transporting ATPase subunit epsilon
MNVEIITPETTIFTGSDISLVQLPGLDGSFEILNNHAPLIAALRKGKVKLLNQDKTTTFFDISGGMVEVTKNKILILAE